MSNSSNNRLRDYVAERLPPGQFVPLPLVLLLASLVGGREIHLGGLALQLGLALSWIFQFRLWDDLHDLEQDRKQHPHRVLVGTQSLAHFRWVAGLVSLGNFVAAGFLLSWTIAFTLLLPLNLILAALYRTGGIPRLLHAQIVLIKYPGFVLMLSGGIAGLSAETGIAILLIHFTFAVYELLHDSSLRTEKQGETTLFINALALGSVWFLVAGWTAFNHPIAAMGLTCLAVAACFLLSRLWRPGATNHLRVFFPAILQLAVLTFLS